MLVLGPAGCGKGGQYTHDPAGDTALPYKHDPAGDTALPYKHDPAGDKALPYKHDPAGVSYNHRELVESDCEIFANLRIVFVWSSSLSVVSLQFLFAGDKALPYEKDENGW